MKIGIFITLVNLSLLAVPALAQTASSAEDDIVEEAVAPTPADDASVTWVDESHAYATDQAQALTEWMDGFFGDPNYDLEKPESILRLEWANTWDEQDDYKSRVRLRGKVRLPAISERLNLVFSGDEGDTLVEDEDEESRTEERAGFTFRLGEEGRSRIDLTMGLKWIGLRPGVRYRSQGIWGDKMGYLFTQRLEWEDDEGFFATSRFNLDRTLSEDMQVRWASRVIYGEETLGVEWRTGVSLRHKYMTPYSHDPFVVSYFSRVVGVTDEQRLENISAGVLFRRQMFKPYFFVELEPSYNLRKRIDDDQRGDYWNIVLRLEVMFSTDRVRSMRSQSDPQEDQAARFIDAEDPSRSEVFLSERRQP